MPTVGSGVVSYRSDEAGIRALLNSMGVRDDLQRRGEKVADRAREIAPVRTGRYKGLTQQYGPGGIWVFGGEDGGRPYADVTAIAPYSYFLERGTRYMAAQHILTRSLPAAAE